MFGLETLPGPRVAKRSGLLICEGESDALAARQAFADRYDDASLAAFYVIAVPGATTWKPEWRAHLEPFPLVYVSGDGDQAGRQLNANVRRDVPWARPVWLPEGADARGILQADGPSGLDRYLRQADADARLVAAFILGRNLEEAERLLLGEEVSSSAA